MIGWVSFCARTGAEPVTSWVMPAAPLYVMGASFISLTHEQVEWPLWENNQTLQLELLPHDSLCWFRKHIAWLWKRNNLILTYLYFNRDKAFILCLKDRGVMLITRLILGFSE